MVEEGAHEKHGGKSAWRMCNEKEETVSHMLSECEKMAQTEYKKKHNNVAQLIYWNLWKKYGLVRAKNWYAYTAE